MSSINKSRVFFYYSRAAILLERSQLFINICLIDEIDQPSNFLRGVDEF